jgi:predicted transcriptional regulator
VSDLGQVAMEFQMAQSTADQAYARLIAQVQAAARAGTTHTKISKETGLSRMTIRKHCADLWHVVEDIEIVEVPTV